ncbi:MAG: four helix bundle protein [Bacteroidetes bacterium]|nr:four helix bundle protein [Bacteroidota bacterium]
MASFEKFEDINAWAKSRELSRKIFLITTNKLFKSAHALAWQINKSAGSIMDNIAEGFERGGNKEFIQFLAIAKGSTAELRSQLYRAFDHGLIQQNEQEELFNSASEISKMINGLIKYIKSSNHKGYKFKERKPKSEAYNSASNIELQTSNS